MLLIYTPKLTHRIQYIFSLYFKNVLSLDYVITTDIEEFSRSENPKLSYCSNPLNNEFFIQSSRLLLEHRITELDLSFIDHNDIKVPFPTYNTQSAFPFDIFAAGFFLVSRYEEYLPFIRDQHNRFEAKQSIAFKEQFLGKPVVNQWAIELKEKLQNYYPNLAIKQPAYRFIPTFDIDNTFAYLHKGFFRGLGGFCCSLWQQDFKAVKERFKVIIRKEKDPFDVYDFMIDLQRKYKISPLYFILFSSYGSYDKNLSINNWHFQSLIKRLSDYASVGLHPSYQSASDFKILAQELDNLSGVVHKPITQSRQHYLMLKLPNTYRNLIHLGITDDYSMGYASETGFRAGICTPFPFYDLEAEEETKLIIHPFGIMDTTVFTHQNLSQEQVFKQTQALIDEVRRVDGTFYMLWHNETFADKNKKKIFEDIMEYGIAGIK